MMVLKRIFISLGAVVALIVLLLAGFAAWLATAPGPTDFSGGSRVEIADYHGASPSGVPKNLAQTDLVTRGGYLTRAADCEACHTAKGGVPFAGGRAFDLPFGTLYTPNITPDRETGIGGWTDAQFLRAVHKGIGRDGERLYPAFPFASYTQMTDADVLAIKAYLFALKPVHQIAPANTLMFPVNQRWLMGGWSFLFNSDQRFTPTAERSDEWNRGAYLVEAVAHCAECHTPRNAFQGLDNRLKFSGGVAEGWIAYNITGDRTTGVGAWSQAELAHYLSTGHAAGRGTASGPMSEVVDLSLSYMTPGDVDAMVAYLTSVPPIRSASLPAASKQSVSNVAKDGPMLNPIGKRIFEGVCVSCHTWSGYGSMIAEAQLIGSRAVNDPSATNVALMVIHGTQRNAAGKPLMPAFGAAYSDEEIADVANYVTARFGSVPSSIQRSEVEKLR